MRADVRQLVRVRANHRCEYCRLPQFAIIFTFHVEHIRAQQHGGTDDPSNLALACPFCNRVKGPNLTSIDPESDEIAPRFNPRLHDWDAHFSIEDFRIAGQTATGRATVALLNLNETRQLDLRTELMETFQW